LKAYTKTDLEKIVAMQLENPEAMHVLLSLVKVQHALLRSASKKLKDEISAFKEQHLAGAMGRNVKPS